MVIAERRDIRQIASDYSRQEFIMDVYGKAEAYARGRIPSEDCEDFAHHCVEVILDALDKGRLRDWSEPDRWTYTIFKHERANYYRDKNKHSFVPLETAEKVHSNGYGNPEHEAERNSEYHALHRAVQELSPKQRQVIELQCFTELGPKDVSGILGITEEASKARRHRAIKSLRRMLSA